MSSNSMQDSISLAREMVALYTQAERAVLLNQSYTIAGQSLTRADLDKIRAGRKEWENKLISYCGGGERIIRTVMPMDY